MSDEYECDEQLKMALERLVPPPSLAGTWHDVQHRVRYKRRRRRSVGAIGTAVVVAVAGYGGHYLWQEWRQAPAVMLADSMPETLTGVEAELWAEIDRVKTQSQTGDLAWADIQKVWEAIDSIYPAALYRAAEGAHQDLGSWLDLLASLQQSLLIAAPGAVVAYLTDEGASAAALQALQAELMAMPEVAKVVYVSKEQALERLRESFAGQPEIFEGLTSNPLPDCLEIYLVQGQDSASFAATLEGRPGIDQLQVEHADFDHETMLALLRGLTPSEASLGVSVPAGLSSTTTATSTASPGGRLSPSGRSR